MLVDRPIRLYSRCVVDTPAPAALPGRPPKARLPSPPRTLETANLFGKELSAITCSHPHPTSVPPIAERSITKGTAVFDNEEFEETLAQLEAVDAVRVVRKGGRIVELHVLAAPSKSPKQVARDIQSLAMARYGVNIDRRVISVVQLASDNLKHRTLQRPALVRIREQTDNTRTTLTVTLAWQNGEHIGSASGPDAASARLRLVGEATLQAMESIFADTPPLALDAIGTAGVGMRTALIAVIVFAGKQGEELVVGSALSSGDHDEAAVKAVLDALNRRLPALVS